MLHLDRYNKFVLIRVLQVKPQGQNVARMHIGVPKTNINIYTDKVEEI